MTSVLARGGTGQVGISFIQIYTVVVAAYCLICDGTTTLLHTTSFRPEARVVKACLEKIRARNPKCFIVEEVP